MTATTSSSTLPHLLQLSHETHLGIIDYFTDFIPDCSGACSDFEGTDYEYGLDFSFCRIEVPSIAVVQLRNTNCCFDDFILAPNPTLLRMVELSLYPSKYRLYACKYCKRMRQWSRFPVKQHSITVTYRYCADCRFARPALYGYGRQVEVNGELWVSSLRCKELKKGEQAGSGRCYRLCMQCCEDLGREAKPSARNVLGRRVPNHTYSKTQRFVGAYLRSKSQTITIKDENEDRDEDSDGKDEAEWDSWYD